MSMDPNSETWTAGVFARSTPDGEHRHDLPYLLEHLAMYLREREISEVLDIILHGEIEVDGVRPTIHVYYDPDRAGLSK